MNHTHVFMLYAREDWTIAKRLYNDLHQAGVRPWMDTEDLLPGQKWKSAIRQAIQASTSVIALLSQQAMTTRGFFHKQLKIAQSVLEEYPESDIFLIPVRLDDFEIADEALADLHCVDLFLSYDAGLQRILKVLTIREKGNRETIKGDTRKGQAQEIIKLLSSANVTIQGNMVIQQTGGDIVDGDKVGGDNIKAEVRGNTQQLAIGKNIQQRSSDVLEGGTVNMGDKHIGRDNIEISGQAQVNQIKTGDSFQDQTQQLIQTPLPKVDQLTTKDKCTAHYQLLSEKLADLRKAYIIEHDAEVKFKLKKKIEEAEADLNIIEQRLEALKSQK